MSMGNYCPYTNGNVVYLKCQECEDKICEKGWFFCGGRRNAHVDDKIPQTDVGIPRQNAG